MMTAKWITRQEQTRHGATRCYLQVCVCLMLVNVVIVAAFCFASCCSSRFDDSLHVREWNKHAANINPKTMTNIYSPCAKQDGNMDTNGLQNASPDGEGGALFFDLNTRRPKRGPRGLRDSMFNDFGMILIQFWQYVGSIVGIS